MHKHPNVVQKMQIRRFT